MKTVFITWLKYLLIDILLLAIVLPFNSCKTKQKQRDKFSQKVELESIKSTLTTTIIDTTLHVRGSLAELYIPWFLLAKGNPIVTANNGTELTLQYDSTTQTLHAVAKTLDRKIPVKATKTELKKEDLKAKSNTKQSSSNTTVKTDVWATTKAYIICFLIVGAIVYTLFGIAHKWFPFNLFL